MRSATAAPASPISLADASAAGEEEIDLAADADAGDGRQAGQGGDDERQRPPYAGLTGGEGER